LSRGVRADSQACAGATTPRVVCSGCLITRAFERPSRFRVVPAAAPPGTARRTASGTTSRMIGGAPPCPGAETHRVCAVKTRVPPSLALVPFQRAVPLAAPLQDGPGKRVTVGFCDRETGGEQALVGTRKRSSCGSIFADALAHDLLPGLRQVTRYLAHFPAAPRMAWEANACASACLTDGWLRANVTARVLNPPMSLPDLCVLAVDRICSLARLQSLCASARSRREVWCVACWRRCTGRHLESKGHAKRSLWLAESGTRP
jgi:hypothetical protein